MPTGGPDDEHTRQMRTAGTTDRKYASKYASDCERICCGFLPMGILFDWQAPQKEGLPGPQTGWGFGRPEQAGLGGRARPGGPGRAGRAGRDGSPVHPRTKRPILPDFQKHIVPSVSLGAS